jgi:hypothetical protein
MVNQLSGLPSPPVLRALGTVDLSRKNYVVMRISEVRGV